MSINFAEYLTYFPDSGVFLWKRDMNWIHAFSGDIAGSVTGKSKKSPRGYRYITIGKKKTKASHVAMFLSGIEVPRGMVVDHINGITTDDRLCNLRVVTRSENQRNNPRTRHGLKRNIYKKKNGFMVQKRMQFGMACFGTYKTMEEAERVLDFADKSDCIYWISLCMMLD